MAIPRRGKRLKWSSPQFANELSATIFIRAHHPLKDLMNITKRNERAIATPVLSISLLITLIVGIGLALAQTPARAARPTPPTRDPNTPGYVKAQELPDGANAPANADGNFILGPTHNPAPEMTPQGGVLHGAVSEFTMSSADSKIYPGIARDPNTFGTDRPCRPREVDRDDQPSRPVYAPRRSVCPQGVRSRHGRALHRGSGWPGPDAIHSARHSDCPASGPHDDCASP